jgi:hypothetical protein
VDEIEAHYNKKSKTYSKKTYSQDQLDNILQIEFVLCEKTDALGLAGHLQAIAYKL